MHTLSAANAAARYYESVQNVLARIMETQSAVLDEAARRIAGTIERDGIIYSLGSGHSLMVAAETYYRAGGMAPFDVIHDRTFGRAERLPGYALALLDAYPVTQNDLLIVISNSGRNPLPVEMAIEARKRGVYTIGITSLAHSRQVSSRLPQGVRLFEVCDLVIDNCGQPGDAAVSLKPDGSLRVGPTSTLAGVFIVNCLMSLAAEELLRRGAEPPVFVSANLDGADQRNARLVEFLRTRIRGL